MNRKEIKLQRERLDLYQAEVAKRMNMKLNTYRKKESGASPFSDAEKLALGRILKLTPVQLNDFFYDGKLPIGEYAISKWYESICD